MCESTTGDDGFHGGSTRAGMSRMVSWSLHCWNERLLWEACSRTDAQDIGDVKPTGRIDRITVKMTTLQLHGATNLIFAMWSAGQSHSKAKRLGKVEEVYTCALHFTVSGARPDTRVQNL